jgi:BolA protein
MTIAQSIYNKISLNFKPKRLEIIDESHKHAGHSGWREGGQTHFKVILSPEPFASMSRVERGRALNALLEEERNLSLHAIEFVFKEAE